MLTLRGALAAGAALAWAGSAYAQTTEAAPEAATATAAADVGAPQATAEPDAPAEIAPPPEPAPPPPTFSDAFAGGTLLFEVRARYEFVDQKRAATLTQNGESFTARTRLGWETGDFHGFKGLRIGVGMSWLAIIASEPATR